MSQQGIKRSVGRLDDLVYDLREEAPDLWVGWVHDGSPEKLPCVLLVEVTRTSVAFADNRPVVCCQTIEARIYAAERERCANVSDTVEAMAARHGFIRKERHAHSDGKARGTVVTMERWLPASDDHPEPVIPAEYLEKAEDENGGAA